MQDAVMLGVARYFEWRTQLMQQMQTESGQKVLKAIWMTQVPPQAKEQLKASSPDVYNQIQSILSKGSS